MRPSAPFLAKYRGPIVALLCLCWLGFSVAYPAGGAFFAILGTAAFVAMPIVWLVGRRHTKEWERESQEYLRRRDAGLEGNEMPHEPVVQEVDSPSLWARVRWPLAVVAALVVGWVAAAATIELPEEPSDDARLKSQLRSAARTFASLATDLELVAEAQKAERDAYDLWTDAMQSEIDGLLALQAQYPDEDWITTALKQVRNSKDRAHTASEVTHKYWQVSKNRAAEMRRLAAEFRSLAAE